MLPFPTLKDFTSDPFNDIPASEFLKKIIKASFSIKTNYFFSGDFF